MVRADLIKKLFSSYVSNDDILFREVAKEIIQEEKKKKHDAIAYDLERILRISKKNQPKGESAKQGVLTEKTNEDSIVNISYSEKCFEDVILSDEKLAQLEEVVLQFHNWNILVSNGVPPVSKLLFYGPPGCGKTLSAKALAGEMGLPLMYVRFDALISSYLGETASNISKVFNYAKTGNYVIFFDEFDAIGRSRQEESEHGEIKRVVNTFLQQIDNFKGQSIIIAATNYEKSLDYAIWRRFDDTIMFGLPDVEEKERLFRNKLRQFNGPTHAFNNMLGVTEGFSHSDVEAVCYIIMRNCIISGKRVYTKKEIEEAVEKQRKLVALRKSKY